MSNVTLAFVLSLDGDFLEIGVLERRVPVRPAKWVRIHRGICRQLLCAIEHAVSVAPQLSNEDRLASLTDEQLLARGTLCRTSRARVLANAAPIATIIDIDVEALIDGFRMTLYGAHGIALRLHLSRVDAQGLMLVVDEASRAGGWNLQTPACVAMGRRIASVANEWIARAQQSARCC